uniref:Uncharacterized protein n=1 Tax=Parascaris equorum TaxID=6256 RepID=A0A914RDV3_PAREQ
MISGTCRDFDGVLGRPIRLTATITSSCGSLRSISAVVWEIMQNSAAISVQKSLNSSRTQRRRSVADSTAGYHLFFFFFFCFCTYLVSVL